MAAFSCAWSILEVAGTSFCISDTFFKVICKKLLMTFLVSVLKSALNPVLAIMSATNQPTLFKKTRIVFIGLQLLATSVSGLAGTIVWNGASGTDTNWSNGNNWIGTVAPGAGDDTKFFDAGAVATVSNVNNTVDATTTIGSLQYGNTNNNHTTLIANSMALNVLGANGLTAGTLTSGSGNAQQVNAYLTGLNGTLNLSNNTAFLDVAQGLAANGNGSQRATLNMSGLGTFNAAINRIAVGSTGVGGGVPGTAQNQTGTLLLAGSNNVAVLYSPSSYLTASLAIEVGYNGNGNPGGIDLLYLGQTNSIFVDSLGVGRSKSAAAMLFNPVFTNNNPVAYFRGTNGSASRVSWWAAGDMGPAGSGSGTALGTNDFSNGTVDLLVGTMVMGQDSAAANDGSSASDVGKFVFTAGTVDVNTLVLGNQESTSTSFALANKTGLVGYMILNGANTVLKVNTNLYLGFTTTNSAAAKNTYGQLNITNGTAYINNILTTSNAISPNNSISLNGATLILSNTLAVGNIPLTNFSAVNSTLGLTITSNATVRVSVGTLTTGGTTNLVSISTAGPVFFNSYPTQFALIKFASLNLDNFGLTNVPGWAPGAMLVSNGVNNSLDLLLPADPRPVITSEPVSYSGSPGDNVTFSVAVNGSSVTPLGYQWYLGTTPLVDGPTVNGSINYGSASSSLTITNAQIADSGSYFVVITNAYGSVTSAPAAVLTINAGGPPTITGPANQTVIQGNNATFSATVAANPAATVYWLTDGTNIPWANSSSLVVTNVQYPINDQEVFSIVASNSFGAVTNSATLTVTVPPTISSQPISLVVTNTQSASFTVAATGVPAVSYQWYKNSLANPISGTANPSAITATLSIANASPSDIASYFVVVQNSAGSLTSSNATLTVDSTMSTTVFVPGNGAANVCYDTPLYVTFSQTPTLGAAGKIRIYCVTNNVTPVDVLDLGANVTMSGNAVNVQTRSIGGSVFTNFPVIITGNTAAIYPHLDVLTSNQTYYVTMDAGTFRDPVGAYFAGIAANAWQFTTKVGGPAKPANLVVAPDYSGDFATVQGAIDSVPANNTTPTIINIRNGTYTEIVNISSRNNLDLRGQSRAGTIIGYPNNNNVNAGAPLRSCFVLNGNDCTLENLTLTNMTPAGGSQAEAVDVEGTRAIFDNMELDSYQDTFLVHSAGKLVYFQDSLIQGQTDFNWGYGTVYYTNCEVRCLLSGGHVTQPRSPYTTNGFGFINCRITKGYSGSSTFDLGRTINTPTSPSEALFANCLMDDVVTGYASDAGTNMADYACSNLTATAVKSLNFSTHSSASDPYVIAIQSASTWLYGWAPALAPNITTQPTNESTSAGQAVSLAASATGIPAPAYQWFKNGTNLPGATGSALNIASAQRSDGASYYVVASNGSGSVTSSVVTLTYVNTGPVAQNFSMGALVGTPSSVLVVGGKYAPTDADGDPLTITGVSSASNGSVTTDGSSVTYTPANGPGDTFTYTVSDGFGGSANGTVTVYTSTNVQGYNLLSMNSLNGTNVLAFAGIPTYNYALDMATNLQPPINWMPQVTNPAANNGLLVFTNVPALPQSFYRTRYVP